MTSRYVGKVKSYDAERGYGFLIQQGTSNQLFVDWAQIRKAQPYQMHAPLASDDRLPKVLFEGQSVSFDIVDNNGRLRAVNVDVEIPRLYPLQRHSHVSHALSTPCNSPVIRVATTPSTAENSPKERAGKRIHLTRLLGLQ
jgi:cold shock CspA family protein